MRSDIEIYLGFYLLVTLFIGRGSFVSLIVYWQLIRIKYIINYNTKAAFTRMDAKISGFVNNPSCPGFLRLIYAKIKGLMVYMSSVDDPNQ